MFAFGVCVGDQAVYERYALPTISAIAENDTLLLASTENQSIFDAYEEIVEHASQIDDLECLVLMHEDVELRDPLLLEKLRATLSMPGVHVVGAVGATGVTSLAWWEGAGRGRCAESRGMIEYGGGTHEVDAVDGLFMALSPSAVRSVPFDREPYRGFHAYDVDYCFSVRRSGGHVLVTDIDLFHHTKGGYGDAPAYLENDAAFKKKWFSTSPPCPAAALGSAEPDMEGLALQLKAMTAGSTRTALHGVASAAAEALLGGQELGGQDLGGQELGGEDLGAGLVQIDLGGGTIARPGWTNLDPVHGSGEWRRTAQEVPWPIGDGAVAGIFASHVMEHIPAGAPRIAVMNEAWRVLAAGGVFEIRVPMFPTWQAIADPTHVSFWVPQSFFYFTGQLAPDADYAMRRWDIESLDVNDGWELRAKLRKPAS